MAYSQAGAYVVKILKGEQPLPLMQPAKWQLGEVGLIGCDAVKARMRSEAVVRGRRDADGRRSPTLFRRGTGRNRGRCYIAVTAYQPTFRYTTLMFPQVLWEGK